MLLVKVIRAAGGILWRPTPAGRDSQSSTGPDAATGASPRASSTAARRGRTQRAGRSARRRAARFGLGAFAGAKLYLDRTEPKVIVYWHMRALRMGAPEAVDEVAWLSRREALSRLDHGSDRRLLLRALAATRAGTGWAFPEAEAKQVGVSDLRPLLVRDTDEADGSLDSYLILVARAVGGAGRRARARRA